MNPLSRRDLFKGAAALGMASSLSYAQAAPKQSAVVIIYLVGGYNALFGSPDSFAPAGSFGVTTSNIKSLGNGLFVDNATFGQLLPHVALSHLATVGINHHLSSHQPAQLAHWSGTNERSHPLMLAKALAGTAGGKTLPCVVVGPGKPEGRHSPEGNVSMQRASDLAPALELFGANPGPLYSRTTGVGMMKAARAMSGGRLAANANALRSAGEGYDSAVGVLGAPAAAVDFTAMQAAYGVTGTAVSTFTHQMMGAELMIRLGTKVVLTLNGGWDTHGDIYGNTVRQMMGGRILPGLATFLTRMMDPTSGYDVTVAILGDFARSLPGSDHASALSSTVIGPRVKVGTTGKMDPNVGLTTGTPGVDGFWSYLAAAANAPTNPFGANPHESLLLA